MCERKIDRDREQRLERLREQWGCGERERGKACVCGVCARPPARLPAWVGGARPLRHGREKPWRGNGDEKEGNRGEKLELLRVRKEGRKKKKKEEKKNKQAESKATL